MRFCNGQSSICLSLQNSQELLVLLEFVRFQWNELICSELNCLWTSLTSEWILILIFSANVWLTWSLVNVLMVQSANLVDGLKPPAWSCVDLPWGQLNSSDPLRHGQGTSESDISLWHQDVASGSFGSFELWAWASKDWACFGA